jgi:hypothetical protein
LKKATGDYQVNPYITIGRGVESITSAFQYPGSSLSYIGPDDKLFGPNFQFQVVPIPAAVLLGGIGLAFAGWKMRKREEL